MTNKLTELEVKILKTIGDFVKTNNYSPTLKELGLALGYTKTGYNFLSKYIRNLADKGLLEEGTGWRKWKLAQDKITLPLLGSVNAGPLATEEQDNDCKVDLPQSVLPRMNSEGLYLLRVSGNSMTPKFEDGDLILIDKNRQVQPGDVIVALIDGQNTLKTFMITADGKRVLVPENKSYLPIVLDDEDELSSQGVVIKKLKLSAYAMDISM